MSSSSKWEWSELGKEAINASRSFSFKTHPYVVFVNTGDVLTGKFLHSTVSVGKDLPGQAKKALRKNDILLTEIRPANGRFAYVDFEAEKYVVSTKFMVIESKGRVLPRFLYHVLTNQISLDEFQRVAESRSGTFPQITFDSIAHFPIPIPPISEQASLVSLFDNWQLRIDLLRETNATLEAIAQALFKSWFVDFAPVRAKMEGRSPDGMDETTAALFPDIFEETEQGLMPKGWKWSTLADAYEINPQRKVKKGDITPYLDMANAPTKGHGAESIVPREMGSGSKFMNGDTLLARITPCLENGKTAFVDFLDDDQKGWGSTEFIVLHPKKPLPEYHAYLLARHQSFRDFAIQSMSGTSGRQRIQNDVLGSYLLALPSEKVATLFGDIVTPIQQRVTANNTQAQTLATLRDTLLPRLISGQLRLPEAILEINEELA